MASKQTRSATIFSPSKAKKAAIRQRNPRPVGSNPRTAEGQAFLR